MYAISSGPNENLVFVLMGSSPVLGALKKTHTHTHTKGRLPSRKTHPWLSWGRAS